MRIRISHETKYSYEAPARFVRQRLRVTPREHDGQHIVRWRVDVDRDVRLRGSRDAFGNVVHVLAIEEPVPSFSLSVSGEVETSDTAGVLTGLAEALPPEAYLRETRLTAPSAELVAFAEDVASGEPEVLGKLHALSSAIHRELRFDTEATCAETTAAAAFSLGRGVCQDLAHVGIAAARRLGIPARYVSGHLARADGVVVQEAAHAWLEGLVPGLGWVGFDPANGLCPTEAYVRVAAGLDYLDAAPVRGSRYGGAGERLEVSLSVAERGQQ